MPTPPKTFDAVDPRLIRAWNAAATDPPLKLPVMASRREAHNLRERLFLVRRECPLGDPRREAWYGLNLTIEDSDEGPVLVFRRRGDPLAILERIAEHVGLELP